MLHTFGVQVTIIAITRGARMQAGCDMGVVQSNQLILYS